MAKTTTQRVFVTPEEIAKITQGSYERQMTRLAEAAEPLLVEAFGDTPWQIVATYPTHLIALGEDGKAIRLRHEDINGQLCVLPEGSFSLKTSTESEYIKAKASTAVRAYRTGSVSEAKEAIADLIRLAPAKKYASDNKLTDAVIECIDRDVTWKRRYRAEPSKFAAFLAERAPEETVTLSPKFGALTESTVLDDQTPQFALVQEAYEDLTNRFATMIVDLEKAIQELESCGAAIVALGEGEVLRTLDSFAQDLLNDVRTVSKMVTESFHRIGRVDNLGKIYDAVAKNFYQYEVASRFVIEMTNSLSEASK